VRRAIGAGGFDIHHPTYNVRPNLTPPDVAAHIGGRVEEVCKMTMHPYLLERLASDHRFELICEAERFQLIARIASAGPPRRRFFERRPWRRGAAVSPHPA
jgi:hypothetical protein